MYIVEGNLYVSERTKSPDLATPDRESETALQSDHGEARSDAGRADGWREDCSQNHTTEGSHLAADNYRPG